MTMTPDTADKRQVAPTVGDLDDIHKRLVRIHQALAEPTNAELHKVRPWTLGELMALIRDVHAARSHHDDAAG
jgi:hypothetical protein